MGVCARDERKSSVSNKETTMVGIRASDQTNRHNNHHHHSSTTSSSSPTPTPLDLDNPNKKMKLLHEIDLHCQLQHQQSSDCGGSSVPEAAENHDGDSEGEEDDSGDDALPIGDSVRVSIDGSGERRVFFSAFQFDGNVFHLEDTALVTPEEGKIKPCVAIIKDIFQAEGGSLMVRGRRFYRPEEAERKDGGTWPSSDARELFYSTYLDEFDASTVMHRCVIHLVPVGKTSPERKQHPGFIVQKFYDFTTMETRNLTETDCEGDHQPAAA